jgi:hypothetical protein
MAERAEQLYIQDKQKRGSTPEEAQKMWTELEPVFKINFINICIQEEQNLEDIKVGLLATLHEYQGLKHIKQMFEKAIKEINL